MTTTTLSAQTTLWQRVAQWIDTLPPLLHPPLETETVDPDEYETLVVVHPSPIVFWLLSKIPVWEEITREEAAQYVLQREVRVRYQPLIVEMDRKTILNEIK